MAKSNPNPDVPTWKKWIQVVIAILSALLGALTENATGFLGNI